MSNSLAKPIEVVEYQTQSCKCLECGAVVTGEPPLGIVPGLDLSVNLQALLVWLGNYKHLSYSKLTELLWELSRIEVGVGTGGQYIHLIINKCHSGAAVD